MNLFLHQSTSTNEFFTDFHTQNGSFCFRILPKIHFLIHYDSSFHISSFISFDVQNDSFCFLFLEEFIFSFITIRFFTFSASFLSMFMTIHFAFCSSRNLFSHSLRFVFTYKIFHGQYVWFRLKLLCRFCLVDCASQTPTPTGPTEPSVTLSSGGQTTTVCYTVSPSSSGTRTTITIPASGGALTTTPASQTSTCTVTASIAPSSSTKKIPIPSINGNDGSNDPSDGFFGAEDGDEEPEVSSTVATTSSRPSKNACDL